MLRPAAEAAECSDGVATDLTYSGVTFRESDPWRAPIPFRKIRAGDGMDGMSAYRIELRDRTRRVFEVCTHAFTVDDEAIDYAGGIDHPFEVTVWSGDRLVANFPSTGRVVDWARP
jgi:hypothetical protein